MENNKSVEFKIRNNYWSIKYDKKRVNRGGMVSNK